MTDTVETRSEKEMTFLEHLDELRICLMRALGWLALGMALGGLVHRDVLLILKRPYVVACEACHIKPELVVLQPTEGLMISLYAVLFTGLLIALPLILFELWRFIEPALEPHEKRWIFFLLPAAVGLFVAGVFCCYWIAAPSLQWLINWNAKMGVQTTLRIGWYLQFVLWLMVSFGVVFELPLVMMFLSMVGLVSSRTMLSKWRHAIVIILIIAAVVTPTWDPVTFVLLALPVSGLYLLSILLSFIMERRRHRQEKREQLEQAERDREYAEALYRARGAFPAAAPAASTEVSAFPPPAEPAPEPEPTPEPHEGADAEPTPDDASGGGLEE